MICNFQNFLALYGHSGICSSISVDTLLTITRPHRFYKVLIPTYLSCTPHTTSQRVSRRTCAGTSSMLPIISHPLWTPAQYDALITNESVRLFGASSTSNDNLDAKPRDMTWSLPFSTTVSSQISLTFSSFIFQILLRELWSFDFQPVASEVRLCCCFYFMALPLAWW